MILRSTFQSLLRSRDAFRLGRAIASVNQTAVASPQGFARPTKYFLVSGVGDGDSPLVAFDRALLKANIGDINLVKLSSIVPPGAARIHLKIPAGSFVGVAYASKVSDTPGETIASAVAIAHPKDPSRASVVMEHSGAAPQVLIQAEVMEMARDALRSRGLDLAGIESASAEHTVETVGATFAGVVEIQ